LIISAPKAAYFSPEVASRTPQNLTDPHVTERLTRARHLRFVRNMMVAAISGVIWSWGDFL
jgi:hypothetical protein